MTHFTFNEHNYGYLHLLLTIHCITLSVKCLNIYCILLVSQVLCLTKSIWRFLGFETRCSIQIAGLHFGDE